MYEKASTASNTDIFEKMANGEFPGPLGVAHRISKVWTEPRNGNIWLRRAQMSLQTYGIVKAYLDKKKAEAEGSDEYDEELKKRDLTSAISFQFMDHFVWQELKLANIPYKLHKLSLGILAEFPEAGAWFTFMDEESLHDEEQGAGFPGVLWVVGRDSFRLRASNEHSLRTFIQKLFWDRMGSATELSFAKDPVTGATKNTFSPIRDLAACVMPANAADQMNKIVSRTRKFVSRGIRRRVLLHGPPGTGKTTLATNLALNTGSGRSLRIDPQLFTTHEIGVQQLGTIVGLLEPTVLQLDDFDRLEASCSMLHYVEHCGVPVVIGTVNSLEALDPALLRPGRFDEVWIVEEPDAEWRSLIVDYYSKVYTFNPPSNAVDLMSGLSPAEIHEIIKTCSVLDDADVFDFEVARVRAQKGLYSSERIQQFLLNRTKPLVDVPVATKP